MTTTTKIIHQDCLSFLAAQPEGSVDLVITSPPYNLKNSTGGFFKTARSNRKGRWGNSKLALEGYESHDDNMEHADYVEWQRECLTGMMRIIPDNGAIFYNHKWRVQGGLLQDRSDILSGFPVRQIIIWHRKGGMNFNLGYFLPTYEVIYLIAKPQFKIRANFVNTGDVWTVNQENNNDHPAPFPIEIPDRIIKACYAKTVCDIFAGSGTTAVAAKMNGVDFIGCDNSQKYCEEANIRVKLHKTTLPLI